MRNYLSIIPPDRNSDSLIPYLQEIFGISLIQEAFFQLVEKEDAYAPLLVRKYHNRYLTVSNKDHYIYLLPVVTPQIIEEVSEASNFIFSRKKILVQLEHCEEIPGFEN